MLHGAGWFAGPARLELVSPPWKAFAQVEGFVACVPDPVDASLSIVPWSEHAHLSGLWWRRLGREQ